jgi:hypothetical protein
MHCRKNTGVFYIGVSGAYCSPGLIKSYFHCVGSVDIRRTVSEYLSVEINDVYLSSRSVKLTQSVTEKCNILFA